MIIDGFSLFSIVALIAITASIVKNTCGSDCIN
jgi:hypothetical protein